MKKSAIGKRDGGKSREYISALATLSPLPFANNASIVNKSAIAIQNAIQKQAPALEDCLSGARLLFNNAIL